MRKQTKLKKILLVFVLIGALLGVQVMEIAAYAAETDTGTEVLEPVEVCSNFTQLFIAVNNAKDGDVIGIDSVINVQNEAMDLGASDKHVTIVRMNESASLQVSTQAPCTFRNLTFDGNGYVSNASMIEVYDSGINFDNVTFQNCVCKYASGAVMIYGKKTTFADCTFQNNSGGTGGHLCIANDAVVTITGCNFTSGYATKGGAIYRSNSGTIGAWVTIEQSKIYGNSASESGGGIYAEDTIVARNAKVYGNTAPLGEDVAETLVGNVQLSYDLPILQEVFADENVTVKGWITTFDNENGMRYEKLDYEEIVEEPVEPSEPSEPTDPGDTEDPDDTGGDTTDPSEPSEGDDPTEPGTGDGDQDEPTDPSQPDDSDQGTEEPPSEPTTPPDDSEEPSTPTDPDDSQEPGDNITTDNSDHSSNDTTTTDKSDHSSIKTDNSVTNTNSGNTTNTTSDNSQRTEDNSSVTYNYYYPSADDSEGQSQQPQQIVIHNYIQGNNEDQGVSSSQEEKVLYDPMKNVSIDAEGVDVVFEVVDGVYSISIKAREPEQQVQQAAEEPATESFMVDWYEVIKIALLGAIVFVVKKK